MATLAEHPMHSTASPMPNMPATYDQDLDTFINFDQLTYTSADSRPKVALASQPSVASTDFSASDARSASFASSGQSPLAFQAPSHHYEEHRQQTGLPPGYPVNGELFQGRMKREDIPFEFNAAPSRQPSEMDVEADGMNNAPFFFSANSAKNQYVDPNALGGHELAQAGPSTQVGRMYPGMHQQQAAIAAKAAQQQKQNDVLRQQQMQQRRVEESQNAPVRTVRGSDPVVEERISRLLQQMRQQAIAAGETSPSPSSILPHMAKSKKDEADMDEDERLLASEEGKKLSSKERRQLRNKVSARAFRSRRKEYIGQLESEIASRTNETHELRLQNRQLFEENARLNDLARMLLGSPHFANFLNDMPDNAVPPQIQAQQQQQQQQQHHQQQQPQQAAIQPNMQALPKEATRQQEFQMQQNPQSGMVMVPNQSLDASMMNNAGWNSGIDINYGNTPVFAVIDVPEGPALDFAALSGKSSSVCDGKDEAPVLDLPERQVLTQSDVGVANPDVDIDESDPAFALFVDSPVRSTVSDNDVPFNGVQADKAAPHFELVADQTSANQIRFDYLCSSMEAAFDRVSLFTSHLQ
ncbi:uncharacterized protein N7477_002182 [Penicillium maclennaniae]|uniref:uncharacterized protein n=1 Tax=Penicillium maclennaniae TaxID=1343394 RepID=UPI002542455B|nr:uncharacterized protein N7477_002182 [Penicillium maclennaniae]KAJ5676549.1 hypothetical protein N7477_002182 [Penicillium maclennaniae]